MPKTRLNQAGDTIIEVLIAVVVVGTAIGLGYGVATRSLKANRQAQERVEALKKVEGQIERLKKLAETNTSPTTGVFQSSSYCITGDTNTMVNIATPDPSIAADPLGNAYTSASPPGTCIDGLYHMSITHETPAAGIEQFRVMARWFSVGSNGGKEESTIIYRLYPASTT